MIEKYVVSLSLAKKLKEAEWAKETEFIWARGFVDLSAFWFKYDSEEVLPAPLAEEILEELPKRIAKPMITYLLDITPIKGGNIIRYIEYNWLHVLIDKEAPKLSDALAQLWLWLKENGYLEERDED